MSLFLTGSPLARKQWRFSNWMESISMSQLLQK